MAPPDGSSPGIQPRAFEEIFRIAKRDEAKFSLEVSIYIIELYCDKLVDLLYEGGDDEALSRSPFERMSMAWLCPKVLPSVRSRISMTCRKGPPMQEISAMLRAQKMNAESSRSHLVVSLLLKTIDKTSNAEITGKITLVDLAGSERQKKTGATGQQVKEANSINKSLSALSNVIAALVKEDSKHVPYRTNILTMLMSDSVMETQRPKCLST